MTVSITRSLSALIVVGVMSFIPLVTAHAQPTEDDLRAAEHFRHLDPYSRQEIIDTMETELSVKYGAHFDLNVLQVTKRGKYFIWCGSGNIQGVEESQFFILTDNPAVKSNIHLDLSSGEFEAKGCSDPILTVRIR